MLSIRIAAVTIAGVSLVHAAPPPPAPVPFDSAIKPFLARNCIGCHNAKLKSGELNLQPLHAAESSLASERDTWERVAHKIRTGEMPPKGVPRPPEAAVKNVTQFLLAEFDRQDRNAKPDPGRVTARRLNRYEYNNTVRDLLGVDFRPADDFPADDAGYGFDHIGDVLSLSPVLMEKYLKAATTISRRVISAEKFNPQPTRARLNNPFVDAPARPLEPGVAGPPQSTSALHVNHRIAVEGDYEIRVQVGGYPNKMGLVLPFTVWLDGSRLEAFQVEFLRDRRRGFELKPVRLTRGEHTFSVAFHAGLETLTTYDKTGRDRNVTVDSIELRGPFQPAPPPLPESHQRLLAPCGAGPRDLDCARRILAPLARRAYRRPVTSAEVDRLARFVEMARQNGDSFERGLQVSLQALLVSPHFLFRIERHPNPSDPNAIHTLNDHELASRLSYFLWSSMPDDELSRLADAAKLSQPGVLDAQARRMLRDPKARALADNFAGQWLELRNLESLKPDPDRFPQFDDELRAAMIAETKLFFETVLKDDRPILDFLDGRYTFLNERLARHYGIPGVEGSEFRRVALASPQRSGVLTQASVLTVSSYPNRTSPVIRGKWILENFLGAPPPPPPPNVPNLDEAAVGNSGSLRQQMEKHRSNPTCASCHARMDPLGFGLENYDAVGAWRTMDGKFPIDPAGSMPDGRAYRSPAELKTILRADAGDFTRCLTEKMLTYALGRGLERYDRPTVQTIARKTAANQYRFSTLIIEIIHSLPFRARRGEGAR